MNQKISNLNEARIVNKPSKVDPQPQRRSSNSIDVLIHYAPVNEKELLPNSVTTKCTESKKIMKEMVSLSN